MTKDLQALDWPEAAAKGATRSLLSEDLQIEGEVTSAGPVEVTGRLIGSLRAPEVRVAANGVVEGQITALNLEVLGRIDGVIAARSVHLAGTSVVKAEVVHELITIESGAQFEGTVKRRS